MIQNVLVVDRSLERAQRQCDWFLRTGVSAKALKVESTLQLLCEEPETIAAIFLCADLPLDTLAAFFRERDVDVDRSSIPTIAVMERLQPEKLSILLEMGATDVFVEPLEAKIVCQRLKNLLSLRDSVALRRAVEHDPVTGICNREAFYKKTSVLLQRNPETDYTLVYMDVEHFKVINELFSANTGDDILRVIAGVLKDRFHGLGTFSRLESDRFALCAPHENVHMDELLSEMTQALENLNINYTVSVYAGVYEIDERQLPVDQMCDRAALALRTVKGNYFNRYAVYDDRLRDTLLTEQQIISEMNQALAGGQFLVYLQPLYSITSGEPISAEALVRWNHPQKGMISPGTFIPLFERNGFITKLDHYVWELACQYLAKSQKEDQEPLPVSVNVSRMNLYNPHLCEEIVALTEKYSVDPKLLKLEITESAYTDNPRQLLSAMKKLHQYGFEILMDDFGSGYSSLNMLKDVPVDILKIDMRFLDDMESSGRAGNVMTSIIRMAKWLNMVVVAEGVETKAQIDFLRSIGCDKVQGFYYSRPMPIDDFRRLMLSPAKEKLETPDAFQIDQYDFDAIWESNKAFNLLFNGMIGGMGIYELNGSTLEVLRVNAAYYELMGSTPNTLFGEGKDVLSKVYPDDRESLLDCCRKAMRSHKVEQVQLRIQKQSEQLMWLEIKIRFLGNAAKRELYYFALNDVTDQKSQEHSRSLQRYGMTILAAYDEARELNFTDNAVTEIHQNKQSGDFQLSENKLDKAVVAFEKARVHPDDKARFRQLHDKEYLSQKHLNAPSDLLTQELRLKMSDGEYHWALLKLTRIDDQLGRMIYVSCIRQIDQEKSAELVREENRLLQAKQKEQQRYQTIVEQTDTAVLEFDFDDDSFYCSEMFRQYVMSETDRDGLLSKDMDLRRIVLDEDVKLCQRFVDRARAGEHNVIEIFRPRRLDGTTPWCRVHGVYDHRNGRMTRAIVTISDINVQMLAELRLKKQREDNLKQLAYLTNLYLTVPCGIAHFTLDDTPALVYHNRACREIFGYKDKSSFLTALNGNVLAMFHDEDQESFLESVRNCRKNGKPCRFDRRIRIQDGGVGYISGVTSLEQDINGLPIVQSVFLGVTQYKEQEESLRRTQSALERTTQELNTLLDNLPVGVGIFTVSQNPRVEYANDNVLSMFGIQRTPSGQIPDSAIPLLFQISEERKNRAFGVKGERWHATDVHHIQRADGSMFWMRSYSTVLKQGNQESLCYAVLADITQEIERERDFNKQTELYRLLMDDSEVIFFDYDDDTDTMVYSLPMAGKREALTIRNYMTTLAQSKVLYPEHVERILKGLSAAKQRGGAGDEDFLADFTGNGFQWYRAFYRSIADELGNVYRTIGRLEDINDEKHAEELLHQERIYKTAISAVSLCVFKLNIATGEIDLIDQAEHLEERFYPASEYTRPKQSAKLIHTEDLQKVMDLLKPKTALCEYHKGTMISRVQCRMLDLKGHWVWVEITLHLMQDEITGQTGAIGYVKEIEDQKKLEQRASFDEVTGVLNRAATVERIQLALMSANSNCYLFIFDVDNFKNVNDRYGHAEGDRMLRLISQTLKSHFRITDIVGRIGGDEFVALLYGVSSRQQAISKANEILCAIGMLQAEANWPEIVSISIGIAIAPTDGESFEELYRAADKALYKAKGAGKGQYHFSDDQ